MDESNLFLQVYPAGAVCVGCGDPIGEVHTRPRPRSVPAGVGRMPAIILCTRCGHLNAHDDDTARIRNLPEDEKRRLLLHPYAAEIRARQEQVVAGMWG